MERKGEEAVFWGLLETMGQVEGEEKKIKNQGGWLQGWRPEMKKRDRSGGREGKWRGFGRVCVGL